MIESLRIRGLGVIADAELLPHAGLTAVTGETGAGKTMVLTGLGLVLGERADASRVRPGTDRAVAEGVLVLPAGGAGAAAVTGAGGSVEPDGSVVLVRSVTAEGRSRAYAGGTAVPASTLAAIGAATVTVHGQADQRRLLSRPVQRSMLDAYADTRTSGRHGQLLTEHRALHAELARTEQRRGDLVAAGAERLREQEMLRHGLAEIAEVDPRPGEDDGLAAEQLRLGAAEDLTAAAGTAHTLLTGAGTAGPGSVADGLTGAVRALSAVLGADPRLTDLARRVGELSVDAVEVAADLAAYAWAVEDDPVRLAMVGERRAALAGLRRRYPAPADPRPGDGAPDAGDGAPDDAAGGAAARAPMDPVLGWAERAGRRLLRLDGDADAVGPLTAERDALTRRLGAASAALTASRTVAAGELAAAVTAELADLAMPSARVRVAVAPRGTVGPDGGDDVEIGLSPHPGSPVVPLGAGVSGGELSRVVLALEVALAGATGTPTYVFDEVDAGIGGRTAVEVGRRLARLATGRQVLVVTHLAQVAAFADRQLVVTRDESGQVTASGVAEVSGPARVAELARMMAGDPASAAARASAAELLESAAALRRDRCAAPGSAPGAVGRSVDAAAASP